LALLSSLLQKHAARDGSGSSNSSTSGTGSTSSIQQYAVRLSFSIGGQFEN
jgi:hypothetical protein